MRSRGGVELGVRATAMEMRPGSSGSATQSRAPLARPVVPRGAPPGCYTRHLRRDLLVAPKRKSRAEPAIFCDVWWS